MNDELKRISKQIDILKIKLGKLNYPNIKLKNKITNLETSYYKLKKKNVPSEIKKFKKNISNVFIYLKKAKIEDIKQYLIESEIINRKLPIYSFFDDIKDNFLLKKKFQDECQIRYILFSSYNDALKQFIQSKKLNNDDNFDSTITKYSKYQKYLTYVEDKELDKIRVLSTEKLIADNELNMYSNLDKLGRNFSYYFYRILFNHFMFNNLNNYFMEFNYCLKSTESFNSILNFNLIFFIYKYELNKEEIIMLSDFVDILNNNNNFDYLLLKFNSFFKENSFSKKNELREFINSLLKNSYKNNTLYINSLNPMYINNKSFLQIDFSMNDEELSKYVINAKKYFETIQNNETIQNFFNYNQNVKFDSLINMKNLTKKDKNRLLGDMLFIFDCKAIGLSNDFIYKQINHDSKLDTRKKETITKYANVILDVIHNNKIFSFVSIL